MTSNERTMQKRPDRVRSLLPLAVLLVMYVALAVGYLRAVPMFEAPDEPSHLEYIAFVMAEGRLPVYGPTPDVPGEGMQAPLYYLSALPLYATLGGDDAALRDELHRVPTPVSTGPTPDTMAGRSNSIAGSDWTASAAFDVSPTNPRSSG